MMPRDKPFADIVIQGLHPDVDSRALNDTFEVFGPVVSAKVMTGENGTSLGYGYVQYDKLEDAQLAIKKANGMLMKECKIVVAPFKGRDERSRGTVTAKCTNIYIKSLPASVSTEGELRKLFKTFGEITSVHMPRVGIGGYRLRKSQRELLWGRLNREFQ